MVLHRGGVPGAAGDPGEPHAEGGAAARDNGPDHRYGGGEGLRRRGDGHPVLCGPRHCRQAEAAGRPGDHRDLRVQGHREGHLPPPQPGH